MKTVLFALIGFTAYTLCTAFCPMNMGAMPMPQDEHSMHMAAMDHSAEEQACDNCEDHTNQELALSSGGSFADGKIQITMSMALVPALKSIDQASSIHRTHLAAADPPIVPSIVKTIVLRT